jgi:hypothetical protein
VTSPTPIPITELDEPAADVELITATPAHIPPLPVVIDGVARVVQVPSMSAGWTRRNLAIGGPAVKILGNDPRRRRAVIHLVGFAGGLIGIGSTQAEAASDVGFLAGLTGTAADVASWTLETSSTDETWAANLGATVVTASVYNEQWAL